MNLFETFNLSPELERAIKKLGFEKPTQIQQQSIPPIIKGLDVIGESATGSGKTLAFGCGIVEHVSPQKSIQALILTPTRELAEQVKNSLKQLSEHKGLKILAVYGGISINPQIDNLQKVEVVVATPGRLLDHLQRGTINLSKVKLLVLDEADRMLDMGFIDDVEKIINSCPKKRQTLFFSATIPPKIKELANKYMVQPTKVLVKKHVDPSKLKQIYYDIKTKMRLSLLVHLLKNERAGLVMVFCNTRRDTDFVTKNLKANKIDALAIHGGLTQNKRIRIMSSFNHGKVGVLVCTDVAARGLHIDNVSHIYNYSIPNDPKDYVHRIGRTARAGKEGKVINLLCDRDHENFSRLLREYDNFTIEKTKTPVLKRIKIVMPSKRKFRGRGFRNQKGKSGLRKNNINQAQRKHSSRRKSWDRRRKN